MSKYIEKYTDLMLRGKLSMPNLKKTDDPMEKIGILPDGSLARSLSDTGDGINSISGDLVDNTDPSNPVINNPAWTDISGKPTTFPPSAHTHTVAQVTGLQALIDGKLSKAGDTMTGSLKLDSGLVMGDALATSPIDLAKFIQLHTTEWGISIESGKFNFVSDPAVANTFNFYQGPTRIAFIQETITDPLALTTKAYVDGAIPAPVTWATLTGKPATFTPTIGVTATTAMAGNKAPTSSERGGVLLQTTLTPLSLIDEEDTIDVDSINIIITQINELLSKIQSAGIIS